jgi:hypothetical protein
VPQSNYYLLIRKIATETPQRPAIIRSVFHAVNTLKEMMISASRISDNIAGFFEAKEVIDYAQIRKI